jgi:hypothetical protein
MVVSSVFGAFPCNFEEVAATPKCPLQGSSIRISVSGPTLPEDRRELVTKLFGRKLLLVIRLNNQINIYCVPVSAKYDSREPELKQGTLLSLWDLGNLFKILPGYPWRDDDLTSILQTLEHVDRETSLRMEGAGSEEEAGFDPISPSHYIREALSVSDSLHLNAPPALGAEQNAEDYALFVDDYLFVDDFTRSTSYSMHSSPLGTASGGTTDADAAPETELSQQLFRSAKRPRTEEDVIIQDLTAETGASPSSWKKLKRATDPPSGVPFVTGYK